LTEIAKYLTATLEELGYQYLSGAPTYSAGDRWFVSKDSSRGIDYVVFIEFKVRLGVYSIHVGFSNPDATTSAKGKLLALRHYAKSAIFGSGYGLTRRPCLSLFDVGRFMKWPHFCIPDVRAPESAVGMFHDMVNQFLRPRIWPVDTVESAIDLYLSDVEPFEWRTVNSVARAIEIVSLSEIIGMRSETLKVLLGDRVGKIARDLVDRDDAAKFIDAMLDTMV
jgi:hypothetical protein